MFRFRYCGAAIVLAAFLAGSSQAQTVAPRSPSGDKKTARVEHVIVHAADNGDSGLTIEIQTSGASVAPDTQAITGPDRIVVDFPGALPAAELRALKVNQGALKGIRTGLFFNDPPITRVVFDLAKPQSYKISMLPNAIVVKLGPMNAGAPAVAPSAPSVAKAEKPAPIVKNAMLATPVAAPSGMVPRSTPSVAKAAPPAAIKNASMPAAPVAASTGVAKVSPAVVSAPSQPLLAPVENDAPPPPPAPVVSVTYANGLLSIHTDKATLAEVLFEVQRKTQADIAIPAGAEQEGVVADLGPASARDVLTALLNGSQYNFVFVGSEEKLEQVILTRRDPNDF